MSSIKEKYWNFIESEDYRDHYLSSDFEALGNRQEGLYRRSKHTYSTLGTPKQSGTFELSKIKDNRGKQS